MRLTVEEHPQAIKRYRHVKPAKRSKVRVCWVACPGTQRTCTLEAGHRGPHVAHGALKRVLAVWDTGAPRPPAAAPGRPTKARPRSGKPARKPVGLREKTPAGIIERLRSSLRSIGSIEEIAFLLFFLAFVGFAIHWLVLIAG